jgi:hypothetical protein
MIEGKFDSHDLKYDTNSKKSNKNNVEDELLMKVLELSKYHK